MFFSFLVDILVDKMGYVNIFKFNKKKGIK